MIVLPTINTGHKIDFGNVQITTQEKSYWRRLIVEGMEIKQLKMGYEIHECWEPRLNKLSAWKALPGFFVETAQEGETENKNENTEH